MTSRWNTFRRLGLASAVAMVAWTAPTTAGAHVAACVGSGVFSVAAPITNGPGGMDPRPDTTFQLTMTVGACAYPISTISAAGTIDGHTDSADIDHYPGPTCTQFHSVAGSSFAVDGSSRNHHLELSATNLTVVVVLTADGPHVDMSPQLVGVMQLVPSAAQGCTGGTSTFLASFVLVPLGLSPVSP